MYGSYFFLIKMKNMIVIHHIKPSNLNFYLLCEISNDYIFYFHSSKNEKKRGLNKSCNFKPVLYLPNQFELQKRVLILKFLSILIKFFAYVVNLQEPGKMESEIAEYGAASVIKKILTGRKPGPPILPKQNPFGNLRDIDNIKLPTWFSEEDLKYYASKYNHNGFGGGLNYYRALDLNWELTAAWTGVQIKIPVKLIVGDLDMVYTTPGMKEYVHGGGFKNDVPLLKECVVIQGAGHFINQERAEEVNDHIHDFIKEF
ncbi:bifunctional epoxide hydrolase 2-like [Olea europaea subsp. europaea]|uniref:Bifunctional epoxide hydrolase 2-like n=1 Tax=Olea europaea subsp. europaea TaxID=158383 RepID=A0A8S0U078_OLEEU|nr:bifunctional epoxide hydrolase 2-like [Olea europaea subsp. europaea]